MNCRDNCGREVADEDDAMQAGWTLLAVAGGYRCGTCSRTLREASFITGDLNPDFVDTLPADSRGALPKETASTIFPSVVRP